MQWLVQWLSNAVVSQCNYNYPPNLQDRKSVGYKTCFIINHKGHPSTRTISNDSNFSDARKRQCNLRRFSDIASWFVKNKFFINLAPLTVKSVNGACGTKISDDYVEGRLFVPGHDDGHPFGMIMELIHLPGKDSIAALYESPNGNSSDSDFLRQNCDGGNKNKPSSFYRVPNNMQNHSIKKTNFTLKKDTTELLRFSCFVEELCGYPLFCHETYIPGTEYKVIDNFVVFAMSCRTT